MKIRDEAAGTGADMLSTVPDPVTDGDHQMDDTHSQHPPRDQSAPTHTSATGKRRTAPVVAVQTRP